MNKIYISTPEEYEYSVMRGFAPLIDTKHFQMDINLRVAIQQKLFGRGVIGKDIMQANAKFFRWIWDNKPHYCEETMRPLKQYSAVYCSHILTRGAYPEMATDPRNINILCFEAHNRWENGDKENMRIYARNLRIIEELKKDYQKLK